MNYTNKKVIELFESNEHLKFMFFWGHKKFDTITKSCLSQWFESKFVVDNIEYKTAEHWMMAKKAMLFDDSQIHKQIISSSKPGKAKELGRFVQNFDQQIWLEHRFDIVVKGNFHKFSQHPTLSEFLINTNNRILVEASPIDTIWGIGLAQDHENAQNPHFWNGQNLLGYALMETRDLLNKK